MRCDQGYAHAPEGVHDSLSRPATIPVAARLAPLAHHYSFTHHHTVRTHYAIKMNMECQDHVYHTTRLSHELA